MKKQIYRFCAAGFLLFCLFMCGCGSPTEVFPEKVTRVSVILPHKDDRYWNVIAEGIRSKEAEAEEEGISIRIFTPQLNYDVTQIREILEQQIAARTDILVVQGNQDPEFKELLHRARDNGTDIICIDTDLEEFPEHLYIGTDNYGAGCLLGENLLEQMTDSLEVAVISGNPDYPNLEQRIRGILDTVSEYPQIHFRPVRYDDYDGLTFMQLYQEEAGADVLLSLEGTGAMTLAAVFRQPDHSYGKIYGFDIADGIPKGILDGIVLQDPLEMGEEVVTQIIRRQKNGAYDAERIYTHMHWITAEDSVQDPF